MAKLRWEQYQSARVGRSEWENEALDEQLKEAGVEIPTGEYEGPTRGTPVHLAVYDSDDPRERIEKSGELASYLKADPGGADTLASYINQEIGKATQFRALYAMGPGVKQRAQERYMREMRGLRSAKRKTRG